ncbi:protein-L-isoaspartate(D-aspartate) O-methyltransferase [Patescibacteria group bacterium]|nr:protein-L-isoaspartate(D-aspartate) O-methyltransferase [Patescibacteria group bacterium]
MKDYVSECQQMVKTQLEARDIIDPRVLEAFSRVPRHEFVSINLREGAYVDYPLSIGEGQTISQPYMVALMTQALQLKGTERVLEVGTGSGYQAAILACLAGEVYSIERLPGLAEESETRLVRLGFGNVRIKVGDGTKGWEEFSPYDGIIVTAGSNQVPEPLLQQLNDGGRLVIPVGGEFLQDLKRVTRKGDKFVQESLGGCRFVPLIGEYGWREEVKN